MRSRLNHLISVHSGQPIERVEADVDRDYYMSAEEALEYGLIDKIVGLPEEVEKANAEADA